MRKCVYACVIKALCLCCGPLLAQHTLVLKDNEYDNAISAHAYVLKGHASLSAIDTILQSDSSNFVRNNSSQEINYGVDKPTAWCAFFVRNESDRQDWILKIHQSRVDTVQLYIVRKGEAPERFPMTGHFHTLPERPVHSLPFAYAITIKKNEALAFYLYTARQYGKHAPILSLQTKEHFENYEYGFNAALSFVCGMVILAAFVGFFLFLFVRQRLYIYYSIYALSFFFVILGDSGFAHATLFFPIDQTVANGFTMIFYYWMGGCLGVFSIELLQLKKYARREIYWFGIILSYALCVIALLLLIPGLPHQIRSGFVSSSYYVAFVVNFYTLYIISISVLKKEPIVYFYMAGFFSTSLIAILLLLSDFEIIVFPHQNKDVYFLAPLIEILCVALGIGIHFSKTLKERITTQLTLNKTQDQIITIQEDERRRIAQDLHDDVGNSLAAIKNMVIQKRESVIVEKEIDTIIETIRTISHDLMPVDFNEFSLVDIITHTVNKFKDHPTLALEFDHTGNVVKIKPLTELVIYRIINELITNIFKHSQGSKALIQLIYQKNSLVVTVEDNGTGIEKSTLKKGIGLRSIRLRSEYIQAQLNIESDDKGTLVILEVPYENVQ
jgi:signal transduction histidine kinase